MSLKEIVNHILVESGHHHFSDKTDYGFSDVQNALVDESKELLFKLKKYEELITSLVMKVDKKRFPQLKALRPIIGSIFDGLESIAGDVSFETVKDNKAVLKSVKDLIKDQTFIRLLGSLKTTPYDLKKQISQTLGGVIKMTDNYIKYKESNKPKFKDHFKKSNLKQVGKSLLRNSDKVAKGIVGVGGVVLGGLLKSSGISNLGKLYLGKVALDTNTARNRALKAKQNILKMQSDMRNYKEVNAIEDHFDKLKLKGTRFSKFGGGGSFVAKRNTHVLLGDNPGGRESYVIRRGSSLFSGKTSGPSLMNMKFGDRIKATPLSGKGISKVNPSDFSHLGAGTSAEEIGVGGGSIVHAINKNTSVLLQIWKSQNIYYKDQKDRADDLANASRGIGKSNFASMSNSERVAKFVESKNKGGAFNELIKDYGKGLIEGSAIGAVLKGGIMRGGLFGLAGTAAAFGMQQSYSAIKSGKSESNWLARKTGLIRSEDDINKNTDSRSNFNPLKWIGYGFDKTVETVATIVTKIEDLSKWFKDLKLNNINYTDQNFPTAPKGMTNTTGGSFQKPRSWNSGSETFFLDAITKAGISDPKERVMFMANVAQETGNFSSMIEKSGSNYEGRKSLGNTFKGDGDKYRGRGFIQLTGRANYKEYGDKLNLDLINHPEYAADPEIAAKIALAWWQDKKLGNLARKGNLVGVRQGINGGTNGLNEVAQYYNKYLASATNSKSSIPSQIDAASTPNTPLAITPSGFKQSQAEIELINKYNTSKVVEKETIQKVFQERMLGSFENVGKGLTNIITNNNQSQSPSNINVTSGDSTLLNIYGIGLAKGF